MFRSHVVRGLLIGLSASVANAQAGVSPCLDQLKAIIEGPSADATLAPLPRKVLLEANKKIAQSLFETTVDLWNREVDLAAVTPLIERLATGRAGELTAEEVLKLKSARKYSDLVRSGFKLFDRSHRPPPVLDNFVTAFGKVNDAIDAQVTDQTGPLARRLLESLNRFKKDKTRFELNPARQQSFARHLEESLADVRKLSSKKTLPEHRFHEMRKRLKEVMNHLQLIQAVSPTPEGRAAYDYTFRLNSDLGQIHDELVAKSLRDGPGAEESTVRVPEDIRDRIQILIRRIEFN